MSRSSETSRLLPIPGSDDDGHELGASLVARARHRLAQKVELARAPDERRDGSLVDVLAFPHTCHDLDRFGFAFRGVRLELLGLEPVSHRMPCQLADDHPAERRHRLHPARRVHDVAGDRLAHLRSRAHRDECLARVDRHADRMVAARGLEQIERGAHRPLGIVLMGDRRAEHAHRRVADELVQRAPEPLDRALRPLVERHERAADILGVRRIRPLGEPREVGEQDRDRPALLGDRPRERRAARHAEPCLGRILGAATRTAHAGASLRTAAPNRSGLPPVEPPSLGERSRHALVRYHRHGGPRTRARPHRLLEQHAALRRCRIEHLDVVGRLGRRGGRRHRQRRRPRHRARRRLRHARSTCSRATPARPARAPALAPARGRP